ncbi:MAG: 23S rRNA pseudouridine(955/2504/2580) synthase RluC [Gammaproteobacteria bacterium]|nr:MAG: 23S rRNA pseudouridine(955/2504/2580) synthase RluC [Gammaproteobacteria bacterium]
MHRVVSYRKVGTEDVGQRIDNYLFRVLKGVPKSKIYNVMRKGEVRVNKGRVKPQYRLQLDDDIRIPPIRTREEKAAEPVSDSLLDTLKARILFEDDGLLAINKPSGLAVHGGSGVSVGLIEALRQMYPDTVRLELVHRLDRDTSGCILISKKRQVLKGIHKQLQEGGVDKVYFALVAGRLDQKFQWVEAPLQKNVLQSGERLVRVSNQGKAAKTDFKVLERYKKFTLLEAKPITGRTHQIRVHAQYIGHSIVGDSRYGDEYANKLARGAGINRLFLHANRLNFINPGTDKPIEIVADLDSSLTDALGELER